MKEKHKCLTCGGEHEYKGKECVECRHIDLTRCSIPCIDCVDCSKKEINKRR